MPTSTCIYGEYRYKVTLELATLDQSISSGKLESIALSHVEDASQLSMAVSVLIVGFLLSQVFLIARVVKLRDAPKWTIVSMILIGVLAGPASYSLINLVDNAAKSAFTAACHATIGRIGGVGGLEYEENKGTILFNHYLQAFLSLYIIGIHGFTAAWAANRALSKRLNKKLSE